jgi:peroxiredoxin/tetratricopeptide (TPR) repeat protein
MTGRTFLSSMVLASVFFTLISNRSSSEDATDLKVASHADESDGEHEDVLAGHSLHGESFNEGPRQSASLMSGMPKIKFSTSTKSTQAQAFFEQGVAQLHGFWYLEAERSFRQAAKEDSNLAIAYWGMAMANVNNQDRARGFIDQAMTLRKEHADRRERLYIEALDRFIAKPKSDPNDKTDTKKVSKGEKKSNDDEKSERHKKLIADIEAILHAFPEDLEAKAWLVFQIYLANNEGVKMTSHYAVDALLGDIFQIDPMHPSHHYRIHLWDSPHPQNALRSAALCGPCSPGIAHMWHMPGHIYSKLKRYDDAVWQQEASARVDHAHMIQAKLLPDQIHNFAHNNEWMIRNLIYLGRVEDALKLSRDLISLPRHPKYNSLDKRGSYKFGRERLLQTLTEFGLWDPLILESDGVHLPTPTQETLQDEWQGWLAVAYFKTGDTKQGQRLLLELRKRQLKLQGEQITLAEKRIASDDDKKDMPDDKGDDKSESVDVKKLEKRIASLRTHIHRAAAAAASQRKDVAGLKKRMVNAKINGLIQAQWLADAGDLTGAIEAARKSLKEGPSQVRPLAVLVDLLWRDEKQEEALKYFGQLRAVAATADLQTPMLARLKPVAEKVNEKDSEMKLDASGQLDWRLPKKPASDLGERPPLDELGPIAWRPYAQPKWRAVDTDGKKVTHAKHSGRPRIVIFYLGFGCLHCIEQLHAFSPKQEAFRSAGIDVFAISTESVKDLKTGIEDFEKEMTIPLLAGESDDPFKQFGCWDDFENQPLHGTFLIDAHDRVRWQDIGYEPFMDVDFLIEESKRLLAIPIVVSKD